MTSNEDNVEVKKRQLGQELTKLEAEIDDLWTSLAELKNLIAQIGSRL